jgi:16S rRNA (uracil1498-N3)-methyltransferase
MHRFLVDAALLTAGPICLEDAAARQIRRVLRLRVGDRVCLFCGDGWEHEASLVEVASERVLARIEASRQPDVELRRPLRFGIALLKGEKLEWVVQKLTELGVAEIAFLQTERVVASPGEGRWITRLVRYAAIAREAAEQCGRVRLPALHGPVGLADYLRVGGDASLLFVHPAAASPLRAALPAASDLRLLIGPEGGFSPREAALARECGATAVSLGARILRSETAALVAAALAGAQSDPDAASASVRDGHQRRRAQLAGGGTAAEG